MTPALTPLGEFVVRLPLGWRCFGDPVRAVATLLHDSGLWFEVTTIFEPDEAATVAVLDALAAAVSAGATGRHHVVVEKRDGAVTARTGPVSGWRLAPPEVPPTACRHCGAAFPEYAGEVKTCSPSITMCRSCGGGTRATGGLFGASACRQAESRRPT